MNVEGLLFGVPVALLGAFYALRPRTAARFETSVKTIGVQTDEAPEPAEWFVGLTRLIGVGGVLLGVALAFYL